MSPFTCKSLSLKGYSSFKHGLMKKLALFSTALILSITLFAQNAPQDPPYKRFPMVPPFRLLMQDSTTIFTKDDLKKNKKTLVFLFSPDCNHCQYEAGELVKNKDLFKDVQVIMAGTAPLNQLQQFYETYQLSQIDNLVMGKDYQYILPSFFMMKNFPFFALYNKKKELIIALEGSHPMSRIKAAFDQ